MLDKKEIATLMNGFAETIVFDKIDSTNTEAKRLAVTCAKEGKFSPVLILAREQSAGRGRMGRSFLSRGDGGIFMSLLYFTDKRLSDAVSVTTAAAAIVAYEIESVTGRPMSIKWVNDIYNEKGKVCGILAETLPVKDDLIAVIVGIGINTGEEAFPEELQNIAASIGYIDGKEGLLISKISKRLLLHANHPEDRGYMSEYRARFMLDGVNVDLFRGGELISSGRVIGVDDDGGLLLLPDGESSPITVSSGEVSVRKNNV